MKCITYILEPLGHPDDGLDLPAAGDAPGGADPVPHTGLGLRVHHLCIEGRVFESFSLVVTKSHALFLLAPNTVKFFEFSKRSGK